MSIDYPHRGERVALNHTMKARQRVTVGISWDVRDDAKFMDVIKGTHYQHDLDLSCYIFDENKEYVDFVGAEGQDNMDQSGKIYHSGDDMTGEGEGDDEAISIELANVPDYVCHMVFLVEVNTNHAFGEIHQPSARIADGFDDSNLYETVFGQTEGSDNKSYIIAEIYRNRTSPTGWSLHNIDDYPNVEEIEDWAEYMKQFLS
jgi:stress response protein SCP2